jgi:hypothetical protein
MGRSKDIFMADRERDLYQCENEIILLQMENLSQTDALKQRVITAKKKLPKQIIPVFIHVYPEFNTEQQKTKLTNVLHLKTADQTITEKLENLIKILQND